MLSVLQRDISYDQRPGTAHAKLGLENITRDTCHWQVVSAMIASSDLFWAKERPERKRHYSYMS